MHEHLGRRLLRHFVLTVVDENGREADEDRALAPREAESSGVENPHCPRRVAVALEDDLVPVRVDARFAPRDRAGPFSPYEPGEVDVVEAKDSFGARSLALF